MDTWMRQVFVPAALGQTVSDVLFAGREHAVARLGRVARGSSGSIAAGPARGSAMPARTARSAATSRRGGRGAPEPDRARASARAQARCPPPARPSARTSGSRRRPRSRVVEELTRIFLADIKDPLTRRAIVPRRSCVEARRSRCHARHAFFSRRRPQDAFDRLLRRYRCRARTATVSFCTTRSARPAPSAARTTTPAAPRPPPRGVAELRAWSRTAAPAELWRYTADPLYLIENPTVREAFFPTGGHRLAVEPAGPDDPHAIEAVARGHEPFAALDLLRAWWAGAPGSFQLVAMSTASSPASRCLCRDGEPRRPICSRRDPVAVAWPDPSPGAADPAAGSGCCFSSRWLLDRESGLHPAPSTAALVLDLKRTYLEAASGAASCVRCRAPARPTSRARDRTRLSGSLSAKASLCPYRRSHSSADGQRLRTGLGRRVAPSDSWRPAR